MKFKLVFVLFNVIIILSFLSLFLMPLFFLGFDSAAVFWKENWLLVFIFFLLIGILNFYFISRWKLFSSLESQDWDSLKIYLNDRIYKKSQLSSQNMKLYINTCLALSDLDEINTLRTWMQEAGKIRAARFAEILSIPLVMKGEGETLFNYLDSFQEEKLNYWSQWLKGFSLYLQQKRDEAKQQFIKLNNDEKFIKNKVLNLLNLYLLDSLRFGDDSFPELEECRNKLLKNMGNDAVWEDYLTKSKEDNVYHVLLDKMIADARTWVLEKKQG